MPRVRSKWGVFLKKRICNSKYDYKQVFFTKNSYRGVGIRPDELQGYVDTVLFRDVVERYGVSQVAALRWLIRQCLRNPAGSFSPCPCLPGESACSPHTSGCSRNPRHRPIPTDTGKEGGPMAEESAQGPIQGLTLDQKTVEVLVAQIIPTSKYFESRFDHMQYQVNEIK